MKEKNKITPTEEHFFHLAEAQVLREASELLMLRDIQADVHEDCTEALGTILGVPAYDLRTGFKHLQKPVADYKTGYVTIYDELLTSVLKDLTALNDVGTRRTMTIKPDNLLAQNVTLEVTSRNYGLLEIWAHFPNGKKYNCHFNPTNDGGFIFSGWINTGDAGESQHIEQPYLDTVDFKLISGLLAESIQYQKRKNNNIAKAA